MQNLEETNSLVELFFNKLNEVDVKKPFLKWLNPRQNKTYTWEEVEKKFYLFRIQLKQILKKVTDVF